MIARGDAQPIAGGPLAMTAAEIHFRGDRVIRRMVAGLATLRRWIAQGPPAAARLAILRDRIAAPRAGATTDRQSVVSGTRVSVSVDLGGRRNTTTKHTPSTNYQVLPTYTNKKI